VLAAGALKLGRPRWLVWLRTKPTLIRWVKGDRQESRIWAVVLRWSMRFPAAAAALSAALLVLLTLPAFGIHTKLLSFTDLPKSLTIIQTYDRIQAAFPGSASPAHVVVAGLQGTPAETRAIADFKRRALATGLMQEPIRVAV